MFTASLQKKKKNGERTRMCPLAPRFSGGLAANVRVSQSRRQKKLRERKMREREREREKGSSISSCAQRAALKITRQELITKLKNKNTHTHTHTHIYIYMYICICVCVYIYIYKFACLSTLIMSYRFN